MADGDEEVGGLMTLRGDGLVGDSESFEDAGVGGAIGLDFTLASDAESGVVVSDVPVVIDENDVFCAAFVDDISFGDDVSADHAPSFADVEEFWPVSVALELVGCEAPFCGVFAEVLRDVRVV